MSFVWYLIATFLTADVVVEGQQCSGSKCSDCLIKEGCVWCQDQGFKAKRCGSFSEMKENECKDVVQRKNHAVEILENNAFSDGGPGLDPIQIKPQRIRIRLAPNSALRNVMIHYKVAKNFPLDLYFLHNPSMSLENLVTNFTEIADDIVNEISNLTTNFRLGFGTAMDKVIAPFVHRDPEHLLHPCNIQNMECDNPYSFLHRKSFTANTAEFKDVFSKVNHSGNQDIGEGMFDGLMQVMVCGDKIGWRNKARRMVVYATDVNFHQAGDGRTAGILEPNDCECHLDDTGKYTKAEIQDFPSVGQIIQKARENNINVIFVIGGNESSIIRSNYYDKLARYLPGGNHKASALSNDYKNIVDSIRDSYRSLCESVKLLTSGVPNELLLSLYSNCRTGGRLFDRTSICEGLALDEWANFTIVLRSNMTSCPSQRSSNMTIFPEGIEDRVEIEVEHECKCDCEQEPEAEPNSTKCNQRGTYECGMCHCNEGWSGDSCECDERGSEMEACGTEAGICSNVGNCTCRKCDCFQGYSGLKCECNDMACPSHNGSLCGGPAHGNCTCRKCVCTSEFSGTACDCLKSDETCRAYNGTICSSHGVCDCGKCRCNPGFSGALCDTCLACPIPCEDHYNCVECVGFKQGPFNDTICEERCNDFEIVSILYDEGTKDVVNWYNFTETHKSCILRDTSGCLIYFNIDETNFKRSIQIKSRKQCPQRPTDSLIIGLGISGAVVLVGIILIFFWKILSFIYDTVEYSRYNADTRDPIWEKSGKPIYMECTPTTQNLITSNCYSRHTDPDNQNKYEGIEPTQIDVHEYKKLENVEENESTTTKNQNKYVKIDNIRVSTHKYTKLEDINKSNPDTPETQCKYDEIDQTQVGTHKYRKLGEIKKAYHDISEKCDNYEQIDQIEADVHKYSKLREAQEIELDSPENRNSYDEINEKEIDDDHYMEIKQIKEIKLHR
nr:integrin beta-6-like isoform X2 [Crassostrea gigas]